ncbi:MAG: FHA domain-containing protein [Deltaproteobacteria bacterium]|nr:MAG: FHA domain-containing protein [Deltaproteobacteria bacterium]
MLAAGKGLEHFGRAEALVGIAGNGGFGHAGNNDGAGVRMVSGDVLAAVEIECLDGIDGSTSRLRLSKPVIHLGRGPGNDVSVRDPRVSAIHGRIVMDAGRIWYHDLGSTNGSALLRQGKRTAVPPGEKGVELQQGDTILLGDAEHPTSLTIAAIVKEQREQDNGQTMVATRALGAASRLPDRETLGKLLQLLAAVRLDTDTMELARRTLSFLVEVFPRTSRAELFLKDSTGGYGPVLAMEQGKESAVAGRVSKTLCGAIERDKRALLVHDVEDRPCSESLQAMPYRSIIIAPLVVEGSVAGAIQMLSEKGQVFQEPDLDLMTVVAAQLSVVLEGARLVERLRQAESRLRGERDYLKRVVSDKPAIEQIVGDSAAMSDLRRNIAVVAPKDTTVLIQGETGVGKELVARAIHERSGRADNAFVALNCAALPPALLESELFGHEKGAFTGADSRRQGLMRVADGGTLFLDEIGELPLDLQPKLLRCLEHGSITPLGSTKPVPVDLRLVCATNRNLEAEVEAGRFRKDLFYRINTFTIDIPPLRNRPEDILPLAMHFLEISSRSLGRQTPVLGRDAAAMLQAYSWPGNVRELRNEMERACILAEGAPEIRSEHLSNRLTGQRNGLELTGSLKQVMERLEAMVVREALRRHGGNRTKCAQELGISRQALIAKIAKLGIEEG